MFQMFFLLVELVLLSYEMGYFSLSPWVKLQYLYSVVIQNIIRMKSQLGF